MTGETSAAVETELKLRGDPAALERLWLAPPLRDPGATPPKVKLLENIYYDTVDLRLRKRGLGAKRSLALREFALGIEALERFVRREPLRRVHECAFAVLALESEPVDPRL